MLGGGLVALQLVARIPTPQVGQRVEVVLTMADCPFVSAVTILQAAAKGPVSTRAARAARISGPDVAAIARSANRALNIAGV